MPGTPSPKRKKTFTVARSIPSTPTLDLSGANEDVSSPGKASMSKEEVRAILNKQIRRDNNGKIVAHAALGTPDDVEQFEEYLATPLSTTKTNSLKSMSSRSLKSSASRLVAKAITSRAVISALTVKKEIPETKQETGAPRSDAEGVQSQVKTQQMKEYKKMLRSMPIHERISMEREKKVLLIWETRNREWERFKAKMSKKLNKPEDDLVMVKASEYRQQKEEYDLINKATPQEEKHGKEYWSVSLRDEGTRFVPVGNVFSGLFCPIREDKNPMAEIIRRPMDPRRRRLHQTDHQGKFNEALQARKNLLRRNIQRIRPHQIDPVNCDGLKVDSQDLFEWATISSQKHYDYLLQSELENECVTSAILCPLNTQSQSSDQNATFIAPCLNIVEELGSINTGDVHLPFHTSIATVQTKVIWLQNPGNITFQFTWMHYGPSHRDFAIEAAGLSPRTFVSQENGVLHPMETICIRFSFFSATPGVFLEKWKVTIDPYLAEHNNDIIYASERNLHLTCVAVDTRAPFQARASGSLKIAKLSNQYMVGSLLREIVTNMDYPSRDARDIPEENRRDAFERVNCRFSVHYSRELYEMMLELYERAQNLISADKQAKLIQGGTGDDMSLKPILADGEEPSPSNIAEGYPPWDGLLTTLLHLAKEADQISKTHFKSLTPRKDSLDDEDDASDGDDEEDDGDDDDGDAPTSRMKKSIFKPVFQLAFEELRHLSLFRPHSPQILMDEIASRLSFWASEIPVVASILELDDEPEVHTELCARAANFVCTTVDESISALYEKETKHAVGHFRRKHLWINDKLPMEVGLFQATSISNTNIVFHVDLDVSHCFTLAPCPQEANDEQPGELTVLPCEWKWMDGIDTFTPAKIAQVATVLNTLIQRYTNIFQSNDPVEAIMINVLLLSTMSTPQHSKPKRKIVLQPPPAPQPSMKFVADKLERELDRAINFVGTMEAFHHLTAKRVSSVASVVDPNPANSEPDLPTDILPPMLNFQIHVVESFELLSQTPQPVVTKETLQPPAEEKQPPKDDKKDKKKGKKDKPDEDAKPSAPNPVVVSDEEPPKSYASVDLQQQAVWDGTYSNAISNSLSGWTDVLVSDTFGRNDWETSAAINVPRWYLGPRLFAECQHVARFIQPHDDLVLRENPRGKLSVVFGGKSFSTKLWLFDGLLEVADEIFLCGGVATAFWRYLHLTLDDRKTCAGDPSFEVDVEPAMSWRVVDTIRRKAARYLVRLFLPFDWLAGDAPLDDGKDLSSQTDSPSDDSRPSAANINAADDDEEEDEDEGDEDEEDGGNDDDETETRKSKKSKKKGAYCDRLQIDFLVGVVTVVEPPETHSPMKTQTYDGTVLHLAYTDATEWILVDDVLPGTLSQFRCRTQTADGALVQTPHIHEWIQRAFDTGPLSMQSLVNHMASVPQVILAGLPGMADYAEFQGSTKALTFILQQKEPSNVLVVGSRTHEWLNQLAASDVILATSASNAAVLKYLVAGQTHPALVGLSEAPSTYV
ncbi:hypothetical protein LEN26_008448 [Aphanomyces euteiches]|nr:hypothetical protein LEN26_008448 [Aphanomyces euteiches]